MDANACGNDANPAIRLKPSAMSVAPVSKRIAFLERKASLSGAERAELCQLHAWLASVAPEFHGGDLEYACASAPAPVVSVDKGNVTLLVRGSYGLSLHPDLSLTDAKKRIAFLETLLVAGVDALEMSLLREFVASASVSSVSVASPSEPVDKAAVMGVDVTSPAPLDPKGAIGATKTPLHLLPPAAMNAAAWVHALGAEKYGPYNWRNANVCVTTYVAAIMRHLNLYRDGIDHDHESGQSHLAHIVASCNILLDAAAAGTLVDDRYTLPQV